MFVFPWAQQGESQIYNFVVAHTSKWSATFSDVDLGRRRSLKTTRFFGPEKIILVILYYGKLQSLSEYLILMRRIFIVARNHFQEVYLELIYGPSAKPKTY